MFGFIKNANNKPLSNKIIIFKPADNSNKNIFDSTNEKGYYETFLVKDVPYALEIPQLQKENFKFQISNSQEGKTDFTLSTEQTTSIEEVNISAPIIIKQDTTVFHVASFIDGTEKKLKDVLEKLPGFEVDKNGAVKVNGKSITGTLVEGQSFFNNNTKLAIDNISANSLENVEVIDNYNESSVKNKNNPTNKSVLNIKLKNDKQNILFGDLSLGGGVQKNYYAHANLFNFNKARSYSFIGNSNNIGEKSFSITDYFALKGGTNAMMDNSEDFFSSLDQNIIALALPNENFNSVKNNFSTLNFNKSIGKKSKIEMLFLYSNINTNTIQENQNKTLDNSYFDLSKISGSNNSSLFYTDMSYKYAPNDKFYLRNHLVLSSTPNKSNINNDFVSSVLAYDLLTDSNNASLSLKNNTHIDQKINNSLQLTHDINLSFQSADTDDTWLSKNSDEKNSLQSIENNKIYNINSQSKISKNYKNSSFNVSLLLQDTNYLYQSETFNLTPNFLNDIKLSTFKIGLIPEYSYFKNKLNIKVGAQLSNLFFQLSQNKNENKYQVLPYLEIDKKWSEYNYLNFSYRKNNYLIPIKNYTSNLIVNNFNVFFQGNIVNQYFLSSHNLSAIYYRYYGYSKFGFSISPSYSYNENGLVSALEIINGIQYFTPKYVRNPFEKSSISAKVEKVLYKINFYTKFDYGILHSVRILEGQNSLSKGKNSEIEFAFVSKYRKAPNFELHYFINNNEVAFNDGISKYRTKIFTANLSSTFLTYFILKTSFKNIETSTDNGNKNKIIQGDFNLSYTPIKIPLSFELMVNNIFNSQRNITNSISESFISENKIYVLRRYVTLKLIYNL
ncbi:hypothetical protein [Halpernia frigidisoli]|nr:hypothetical protein [Halpernia frigidisoli]